MLWLVPFPPLSANLSCYPCKQGASSLPLTVPCAGCQSSSVSPPAAFRLQNAVLFSTCQNLTYSSSPSKSLEVKVQGSFWIHITSCFPWSLWYSSILLEVAYVHKSYTCIVIANGLAISLGLCPQELGIVSLSLYESNNSILFIEVLKELALWMCTRAWNWQVRRTSS